ncbi:sialate O-acetylesterase [Tunturiibacter gelidoferens]|uniref:Sialate O-acetylesterase n=2 Tax=Tunturiibacter TaxID=3154218 RepID=A0A7Y9NIE7_9BACT|nr:sialate O-acetylesterase [Edaphobacter lichenicola]MBB5340831.1 sialate O-acetylesterase [Edaphobacter lichenicola]NYF49854.1 sialate O-acetylesterase [Edaphobacter lichenicola]
MKFRLTLCLFAATLTTQAEVSLPKIFSSHMVLQRDMPIHIWGSATPGESITATFHDLTNTATTDATGRWSLYLPPQPAGGPYTLTVRGSNTITYDDILLGDLWFASGQSNMEMPLSGFDPHTQIQNAEKEIAAASYPNIRLLRIEKDSADYPAEDVKATTGWSPCTPESAKTFSAVAYFFGRDLQKALADKQQHIPIGLIDSTWGGTLAEAWTSLDTLGSNASLLPVFAARAEKMNHETTEIRQDALDKANREQGKPVAIRWHPDPDSWRPAGLYNAMVAPFTPLPIKGVIWYQGEANSVLNTVDLYDKLLPALIQDWRQHWAQGNLPFLYVQISAYASTPQENWGELRDAQRKALSLVNTGMAVTIDIGNEYDVHPANKQTVGERLSLLARRLVYNEDLAASGPLFRLAYPDKGAMHVWFDNAAGLHTKNGALEGFEVAGSDRVFLRANAHIDHEASGDTVIVASPAIPNPQYVRYAWPNFPQANLYNGANLPASTFTSLQLSAQP